MTAAIYDALEQEILLLDLARAKVRRAAERGGLHSNR